MGVVYRAWDRFLNKDVAIKTLLTARLTPDQFLRFQNEAKALGKLQHNNLISVYTFGEHDELPYMVVDFIDGVTLSEYLNKNGPLTFEQAFPIFEQICDGMAYAHGKGVLHRDLKTANIMLRQPWSAPKVVILDFGIAKLQGDVSDGMTQPGQVIGSPLYMSPEQTSGSRFDARSDIYALGCIMFEVLTGKTPFPSVQFLELMRRIQKEAPPSLSEACPEGTFTEAVEYLVKKTLAKSPASRYQKMTHLKVALSTAKANPDVVPLLKVEQSISRQPIKLAAIMTAMALTAGGVVVLVASQMVRHAPLGDVHISSSITISKSDDVIKHITRQGTFIGEQNSEGIDDETLRESIEKMEKKSSINLKDSKITDKGLDFIPADVIRLNLTNTKITDKGLRRLTQRCKKIFLLQLTECHNLTDKGLDALVDLPELEYLTISSDNITDDGMKVIRRLKRVNELSFEGMKHLTNRGLGYIVQNPNIRTLRIDNTSINSAGLPLVGKLKNLFLLDIGWLNMNNKDLDALPASTKLRVLDVSGNPITPSGLQSLRRFKHLEKLMIRKVPSISEELLWDYEKSTGVKVVYL